MPWKIYHRQQVILSFYKKVQIKVSLFIKRCKSMCNKKIWHDKLYWNIENNGNIGLSVFEHYGTGFWSSAFHRLLVLQVVPPMYFLKGPSGAILLQHACLWAVIIDVSKFFTTSWIGDFHGLSKVAFSRLHRCHRYHAFKSCCLHCIHNYFQHNRITGALDCHLLAGYVFSKPP